MSTLPLRFALVFGAIVSISLGSTSGQNPYVWVPTAAGTYNWNQDSNWTGNPGGYPNTANIQADLTANIVGDQTIVTSTGLGTIPINRMTIGDASNSYTVRFSGGTTLTFGQSGPGAVSPFLTMNASSVNQFIDTPIVMTAGQLAINQNSTSGALTISQAISGAAAITKTGAGVLILSGNNTYSNGTTISAGTIRIGAGGTTGSVSGNITNNASLIFDRSDASSYGGVVSGSGSLTKQGAGTLSLTGTNTYSGGTTVSAGTLQIGNGGTTGSITGNITNNSAVTFNRSDSTTFAGVMSGSGSVTKLGAGTLTLTGNHSYAGDTTISAGTLQLGNGGSTGSVAGNIVNNAALVFNRTDPVTYGGVISGTGSVTKLGGNTLTLTGANTYTGPTSVSAGTLILDSAAIATSASSITVATGAVLDVTAAPYVVGSTTAQVRRLESLGTVHATSLTVQGPAEGGGGVIAPGTATTPIGTLSLAGPTGDPMATTLTFASGGTYELGYGKLTGTFVEGVDNDFIHSTGTLNITADGANKFYLRMKYTGSEVNNGGDITIKIATFDGGITGVFDPTAFLVEGDFAANPGTFIIAQNGNDLMLTFSPVPEPTTVLGIATLGLASLGYIRRRYRATASVVG